MISSQKVWGSLVYIVTDLSHSMDKASRIQQLKAAKAEALAKNEQQVKQERRRAGRPSDQAQDGDEGLDEDKPSSHPSSKSILSYTIEDTDKWNQTKKSPTKAEDLNHIAALTYLKETEGLEVDLDQYQRHKTSKDHKLDLDHKPDPDLVKKLREKFIENNDRKRNQKRRGGDGDEAYISRKNRDFNNKLAREYGPKTSP